ncbi:MAG: hypothetical protein ACTHU1_10410 [Arachnia sp.]
MSNKDHVSLKLLPALFEEARQQSADREWAEHVIGRLLLRRISHDLISKELTQVVELVHETGEGPDELFGGALEYVETQLEQWRADGAPIQPLEPDTSWRDVPAVAAGTATLILVMFLILEIISGNWSTTYTLGKVVTPALMGATAVVSITTFETLLMRTRRMWSILGALVVVVIGISLTTATFVFGNDHPFFDGPLWWYLGLVAVHALGTFAAARLLAADDNNRTSRQAGAAREYGNGTSAPATRMDVSDEQWSAQLAGILRLRVESPEGEIRSTITEAREHAAMHGTSLVEEFGPPSHYASRLPRSTAGRRMQRRRRRIFWVLVVMILGYFAFEGLQHAWELDNVRWLAAIAFVAACSTAVSVFRHPTPDA